MMYKVLIADNQNTINQIIDLRYAVLRQPWDKPKDTATDELELSSINAYIENDREVIACGRVQDNGNGIGQIRYMAVHPDYQGKGLGKLIITRLEEEAKAIGLKTLELQARENALEFYKSQGYLVKETSFKLWDIIQHYLMTKELK
ncbi:MAG: GNAT family N-acetyltransferase [Sphingobacteriaceae bacterium]|nr:GNAT family N-acetyltransferase [Sphingobacteriaceae bacterium]